METQIDAFGCLTCQALSSYKPLCELFKRATPVEKNQ